VTDPAEEKEWRGLIERLHEGKEPPSRRQGVAPLGGLKPMDDPAPLFDDVSARNRVGVVITKAVLGDEHYRLYRLYCGEPPFSQ
jgi:hypothetical protein